MSKYIRLTSLNRKGKEQINKRNERIEAMRELAAESGGTIEDVFLTFGDYDFITIADFPDHRAYTTFALKAAEGGEYDTKTLKALEEDEYISVIESL